MKDENVQKRVADTIGERPTIIRFSLLPFFVYPITYNQIWDIGEITKDLPEITQDKVKGLLDVSATLLFHGESKKMAEIAVLTMFRSSWMRWLFGGYIKKRLTVRRYKKLQDYMAKTMDATFFLHTIIFLKGLNEITRTTNTPEVTPLGQPSAE